MTIKKHTSNQDDELLRDGEVLRVKMLAMDSVQDSRTVILSDGLPSGLHKPGYRYCKTDSVAETKKQMARDEYERTLCDAWQTPAPGPITSQVDDSASIVDQDFDDDCYAAYNKRISNQWKGE